VKTRRWLARAPFALMAAAVAILLGLAGWRSLALIASAATSAHAAAGRTGSWLTGAFWGGSHSSW